MTALYDWRKSLGRPSTQVARAILCHFLEKDCGFTLTDAVRHGDRDAKLVELCLAEGWAAGFVVPPSGEMIATANALIVREHRTLPKAVAPDRGTASGRAGGSYDRRTEMDPTALAILGGMAIGAAVGLTLETGTPDVADVPWDG